MSTHDEEELLLYPDLADAYVGIVQRFGQAPVACYDYAKVIAAYIANGMTEDEAVEFFEFNVMVAWVGERTPCFLSMGVPPEEVV